VQRHWINYWMKLRLDAALEETETLVESLAKRAEWLECLEAAGVDNWEGYSDARAIQRGEDPYE